MKIKSSTKEKKWTWTFLKYWKVAGATGLIVLAFCCGLIFNQYWHPAELIEKYKNQIIKTDKTVAEEIRGEAGLYNANGLATIFLDIPFESLMSIEEKRNEALQAGILLTSDDDLVPASMHVLDGAPFDIKLRLKGDWADHLNTDKWSFRIHIKDDNASVLGVRRFSLQAPQTRNYEKEWAYHQNLMLEGVLTTRYYFVNVVINGEYKGIYALEESFTEDLLEAQERREGVIIRLNEDLMWKNWENLNLGDSDIKKVVDQIGEFWLTTSASNGEIIPFREARISADEILHSELVAAIELLYSFSQGELAGEKVFDQELWGKFFAVTDLWGAGHATAWHNLRFYYNPVTALLEPIAYDALPFEPSTLREDLAYPFASEGYIRNIFIIPGVQKAYVETLEKIASHTYLENLDERIGKELEYYHQTLSSPLETGIFGGIPPLVWDELRQRAFVLSRNLTSPQPLQSNYKLVRTGGKEFMELDVTNLMILPVQINELILGGESFSFQKAWCSTDDCLQKIIPHINEVVIRENTEVSFSVPIPEISGKPETGEEVILRANLYGGEYISDNPVNSNYIPQGIDSGGKPIASLEETLSAHPFLTEMEDGLLAVSPGDWNVEGDLIIPEGYDLVIPSATSLKFGEGNILLVYGRLDILGTPESPVLLTSQGEHWSGVVVLNASEESAWQHVRVEKMSGVDRGGWVLTGGITFYESPVNLTDVIIGDNTSEDALNVIRSSFNFSDLEFFDTASDAFDGDFTEGVVTDSYFHDIGGDAFDISGSIVTISDSKFVNISDKAISAGEKSKVTLKNLEINTANIGVASKDLSEVHAQSILIQSAKVAGLAAYIKKPQYGPAQILAENIKFDKTEKQALCQLGSEIVLNGEDVSKEDVDVEALYEQGILGN